MGIKIHTLVYIKYITNKDLLYSMGKYTQYLVITFNEKDNVKKNIYIYIHIYIFFQFYIYVCVCVYNLEKAMASHSSTLAWKIPWAEEPGRLQSMGSLRVGYN